MRQKITQTWLEVSNKANFFHVLMGGICFLETTSRTEQIAGKISDNLTIKVETKNTDPNGFTVAVVLATLIAPSAIAGIAAIAVATQRPKIVAGICAAIFAVHCYEDLKITQKCKTLSSNAIVNKISKAK